MKSFLRFLLSFFMAVFVGVIIIKCFSWSKQNETASFNSAGQSSAQKEIQTNPSRIAKPAVQDEPDENLVNKAFQTLSDLPLRFIANAGQTDPAVFYTVKGAGHTLYFTQDEVVFDGVHDAGEGAVPSVIRLSFEGANPKPLITGMGLMPGVVNYFLGNDPQNWHTSVDTYAGVSYHELYEGVDLVYRGDRKQLKSEFLVAPGADPNKIQMVYSGVQDAFVSEDGALVLVTHIGQLVEGVPLVYQQVEGAKTAIPAGYILEELPSVHYGIRSYSVMFEIGEYDLNLPLLIDPVLAFSSFLGGSNGEKGYDIAVDDSSNIYITGRTNSSDYPTSTNAIQDSGHVFVTQIIESSGVYTYGFSTYLGGTGSGIDYPYSIAVDGAGDIYIAGMTSSFDFPIVSAPQPTKGGSYDGFVVKITNIDGSASLAYSSYLGGSKNDGFYANEVDSEGNHYVTGETISSDYPTTTNAIQPSYGGESINIGDIIVTKIISASGVYTYGYSSYLGGSGGERGTGIAVGDDFDIYLTGYNYNSNYPMVNQVQASSGGGDAVVTKLQYTGNYTYEYSTYLGGGNTDWGYGIAVDDADNAYITGRTGGAGFPITNAVQPTFGGVSDIFVSMLKSTGGTPVYGYSTYIGGNKEDNGIAIAVDGDGNAHVTGVTESSNFPTRSAIQPEYSSKGATYLYYDATVTKIISATGVYTYAYSTYIGGWYQENEYYEEEGGIAVDVNGDVYVVGTTGSDDFPITQNAIKSTGVETWLLDAFVLRIIGPTDLQISKSVEPAGAISPGMDITYTLVFTNNSLLNISGIVITDTVPISLTNVSFTSSGALITATQDVTYAWQVEPLVPGAVGYITIHGTVDPSVSGSFTMTNKAIISAKFMGDDNPIDNISDVQNLVEVIVIDPITGLSAVNDSPTIVGGETTLTATVTAGSDVNYSWDFGDSTSGSEAVMTHTYPSAGVFSATVTATNTVSELSTTTLVTIIEIFDITAGGGSYTTTDKVVKLDWTADITETLTVSYTPLLSTTHISGNFQLAGLAFHLEVIDGSGDPVTDPSHPITLTVQYNPDDLPPGTDEELLELERYDTDLGDWVALTVIARDTTANTITVVLNHFSEFALIAPKTWTIYLPLINR